MSTRIFERLGHRDAPPPPGGSGSGGSGSGSSSSSGSSSNGSGSSSGGSSSGSSSSGSGSSSGGSSSSCCCWQVEIFDLAQPDDQQAVGRLLDARAVTAVVDTLPRQLADLVETRHPEQRLSAAARDRLVAEHLGGAEAAGYGRWILYPWSGRLVHVLPEAEFRELRTSRNRNKITLEEQERLRGLCLGIVGLSVGQATAVTLALEDVGGLLRLADFDELDLSNLNRLRAGVHDLGQNKAVLTARQILESNPYAQLELYTAGISEENLEQFLVGGRRLDLVFDECDDLATKIRLRERARVHRIPVVMETSDRGMIDIERFDLEPGRPLLHGLVGQLRAAEVAGLTAAEKVPYILRIIGASTISPRLAASLVDVETTIKTWPQLASAVALGGALNTDVARRIALGSFDRSGRYYVDLEQLISAQVDGRVEAEPDYQVQISPLSQTIEAPQVQRVGRGLSADQIRTLVTYAAMAPSGGNVQPWHFTFADGHLDCHHVIERSASLLDFEHSASYLACGALAENLEIVAREMGLQAEVRAFPDPADPTLIWTSRFRPWSDGPDEPFGAEQVARRLTNRRLGEREPLEPTARSALLEAADARGVHLQLLEDSEALAELGEILGAGDRLRFSSRVMHQEMMQEIRWTQEEVERTRDGLDLATLELSGADLAGMRLVSSWRMMKVVGKVGGRGLEKPARKALAAAAAAGMITVAGTDRHSFLRGGRAMQRVWLAATAQGLAFQPMTAITYLFARLERGAGEGLSVGERERLAELRQRLGLLFDLPQGHAQPLLFRLAKAAPPTARSLRRRVDDILTIRG